MLKVAWNSRAWLRPSGRWNRKDVYIPLVTKDVETARRIRDGVLHGLKAGGFVLSKIETPPDL